MALRPPNLVDLSTFGIHVNNHGNLCCRCGNPTRDYCEGIHADELCRVCGPFRVKKDGRVIYGNRQELVFYRPRTVWVMTPQTFQSHLRVIWNGELVRQAAVTRMSGVVKVDGVSYVTHGGNLYHGGTCVRQHALHLDEEHLREIYAVQQRTV